jgi:PAS domain S-box-containing protein
MSLVLFAVMLAIIGVSLFITSAELDRASEQEILAHNIAQAATELGYLTNDYVSNGEPQQKTRWETRFTQVSSALDNLDASDPTTAAIVADTKASLRSLQTVFADVANTIAINPPTDPTAHLAFIQVSWSRLQVPSQAIIFDATRLPNVFEERASQVHLMQLILLVSIVIMIAGYFMVNYFLVYRRTLRSIGEIQTGARFIGAGNFDYVLPSKYDDEISDLSRSFNKMTASLKTITASKSDLEKEMARRAEAEEELRITNEELRISNENLQANARKLEESINDLEASRQALRSSEAKSQAMIKYAATGIYELDYRGPRFLSVNDAMTHILGYSQEELLTINPMELLDAKSAALFGRRVIDQLAGRPIDPSVEYTIRRRDGSTLSAVLNITTNYKKDEPTAVLVVAHDVTERKRAEEALKRSNQKINEILSSISDDFYVLDRDWNFAYANRQFTSKTGKEPEDVIGNNIWQMFPEYLGTILEDNFRAVMDKRQMRRFEDGDKHNDRWYRITAFPSAEGITVLGEDVTEIMKAKESLGRSYEELERINRVAVGRELRMIELKKEINRYYIATGQPPRYELDLDEDK